MKKGTRVFLTGPDGEVYSTPIEEMEAFIKKLEEPLNMDLTEEEEKEYELFVREMFKKQK